VSLTSGESHLVATRSRKGARTRSRLLDAAKKVFEDNGFLETRISDIAERAGLSHGAFYHYFDSKEQIFREVTERIEEQLGAPMAEVILARGSASSPPERVREALQQHLQTYRREARIMRVIEQVSRFDEQVDARLQARRLEQRDLVTKSIRQLQRRGMADPRLKPSVAAAALGSMTSQFAEIWLAQGLLDCHLDDGAEQLTCLFVNALGLRESH
jgi:AcrR family transcriptional regulator